MNRPGLSRVKRAIDIVGAAAGLVILSPLFLVIGTAVAATSGLPLLFLQRRIGQGGRPFVIRKFRTMRQTRPGEDWSRTDGGRVTSLGRWLRRSSFDELPELYNVLRGEMSLVGPRPLVVEYLDRFSPVQMRRHETRPGITGLAQVSGREDIPFSRRLSLDVWYVDNWSLWLDAEILLKTLACVVRARGVDTVTLDMVDDVGLAADKSRFITESDTTSAPLSNSHLKQRSG